MDKKLTQIKDFFAGLTFDSEAHKYYVDTVPLKGSVSTCIKDYYEEFNSEVMAPIVAKKEGIPVEMILERWKTISEEACALGTRVHLFGEIYPFHQNFKPRDNFEVAVTKVWKELPSNLVPCTMELKMYHTDYRFGGMMDCLLYNKKTGKFVIADYKTNKDLYKNFKGRTMYYPFDMYLDMPLSHYYLQLSYYQILLEQAGVEIESRVVIWLKPDATYELLQCPDLTEVLREELKNKYNYDNSRSNPKGASPAL